MAQNGASHNRQIRIGAYKIMGELFHKIQQFAKCIVLYLHWNMLTVKYDTMFVIVYIGRILHIPVAVLNRHRHNPVVLPRRMIQPTSVAFVLFAEQTFGITTLLGELRRRDSFGIFFRLGQIDRNVQTAVFRFCRPLSVLCDTVSADIVRILAELIVKICSFPG